MKTNLLLLAALLLASCSKTETPTPEQQVTYTVDCNTCLVYVEDQTWNADNEQERSRSQHFNVSGTWRYQWTNTNRDSVTMRIVVSVFAPRQVVKAGIQTNDGRGTEMEKLMGFDPTLSDPSPLFDTVLTLKLR